MPHGHPPLCINGDGVLVQLCYRKADTGGFLCSCAVDLRNGLPHALDLHMALIRHHIDLQARINRLDPGQLGVGPKLSKDRTDQAALFDVDQRVICIGRKGVFCLRLPVIVIGNVAAAALLIGAPDQAYIVLQGNIQLLQTPERIQRRNPGPLSSEVPRP